MKNGWRCICASIVLLLSASTPASAHRLDEYLQATTFSIGRDRIAMRMRLAPGVAVASRVLATIDRDRNGIISDAEQRAYIQQVVRDLTFRIDGHPVPLVLDSETFAAVDAMNAGVGDIVLEFSARLSPGPPPRVLTFENRHQRRIAAYLVNCLVPSDSTIRVDAQDRSYNQSSYELHFTIGGPQAQLAAGAAVRPARSAIQADRWAVVETYVVHGVHHILTGYDHLLFAIALVLAAATLWELVKVVTAFTIAHSITLTLATLGLAHVPQQVVEPIIAASIVFVAVQNIVWPDRAHGWSRLAVAFVFGLFHGLAFAGGLLDLMRGMQQSTVILAILGFSIGVETGHQIVLLPLFTCLRAVRRSQTDVVKRTRAMVAIQRVGSAGIAAAGAYYLAVSLSGTP